MKPNLDRSAAPLLVATFYPSITADEARAHFREVREAAELFERVGVVVDLSNPPPFTWSLGRTVSTEMRATIARISDKLVGVAHVTPSAAARATLAAMQWLAPPTFPTLATSLHGEASGWVAARLAQARSSRVRFVGSRDARVAAGIARTLVIGLQRHGTSSEELEQLGIRPFHVENLDGYIPYTALANLCERLSLRSNDPYFGLHVGAAVSDPTVFGVVGMAAHFSSTLIAAFTRLTNHGRLIDENMQFTSAVEASGTRISLSPQAPIEWPHHYAEFLLAAVLNLCRVWTGVDFPAHAVGFRHKAAETAEHARFFQCSPAFEATDNFLVIPTHVLERQFASCDPLRARYLDARLEEMAQVHAAAPGALADVRLAARTLLSAGAPVTTATVAVRLGLSSRTLQRRLNERGVTFAALLDCARRELAMAAITRPRTSIQEVSLSCGFLDMKSFRRAFVRWTGQSPSDYRKSHQ
jgi:AraC-like DNA-binding protein